ncbi:hypothetical protein RCC89_06035 [Cytophagaceae bacterium ABcell3]|nr:hypothetical protein RCC89_06035 [Cytophagaceae bacterium ABcell3]
MDLDVFEFETPIALRVKDDVYDGLEEFSTAKQNLEKRVIYPATMVMLAKEEDGKNYYKLLNIEEFFCEDLFLLMTNVPIN